MTAISPGRIPGPLVTALLLFLAVNCSPNDTNFSRQLMIHKARRSIFNNLWYKLGEPFRTLHSANVLLLGLPKNRRGDTRRSSQPKTKSTPTIATAYTTSHPAPVPATQSPPKKESHHLKNTLTVEACTPVASGSAFRLVTQNLQRLRTTECGKFGPRLLDGEDAMPGEFPWLAIIKAERYYFPGRFIYTCGGSLINERYVLTAAHCVKDSRFIVSSVILGEYNTETKMDECSSVESLFVEIINGGVCHIDPPIEIKVECIASHPRFKYFPPYPDDIALVRLQYPVEFSAYVNPICLPLGDFNININEDINLGNNLTVAGWGMTMNESRSSTPMKADIPLMDQAACKTYVTHFSKGKFCVGDVIGSTPCPGDSGGPLFVNKMIRKTNEKVEDLRRIPRAVQVGIVSAGPKHCEFRKPTLFTNVQDYLLWILGNVKP